MIKLENKSILITGGGRGLGRSIAVAAAREGAFFFCREVVPIMLNKGALKWIRKILKTTRLSR